MKIDTSRKFTISRPSFGSREARRRFLEITTGISSERLECLDKYIKNSERGYLPPFNDGADVTRQITAAQVSKFESCRDCRVKPAVFVCFEKRQVGVCARHWVGLAETVIGWGPEK